MAKVDWRHHIRIRRAARLVAPHPSRASSAEHGGLLAAPRRLFHACPALFIDARDSIVRLSDKPGCRKARRLSLSEYSVARLGCAARTGCSKTPVCRSRWPADPHAAHFKSAIFAISTPHSQTSPTESIGRRACAADQMRPARMRQRPEAVRQMALDAAYPALCRYRTARLKPL